VLIDDDFDNARHAGIADYGAVSAR
jgi:hypothetical protein